MRDHKMLKFAQAACLLLGMSIVLPAAAMPIFFEATLDGAQANGGAGTGSAGTGSATLIFDDSTSEFSWEILWQDLSAPALVAHFHGPAAPGVNAGIEVGIPDLVSPSIGADVLTAGQAADLVAGLWYINIHTVNFLGGEIRGQVLRSAETPVPIPSSLTLLLLGMAGLFTRRLKATDK